MLLSCEPPMYGRRRGGPQRDDRHPPAGGDDHAAPAATSWQQPRDARASARRSGRRARSRARPVSACSIFVRKPKPTSDAAPSTATGCCRARAHGSVAYAAATSSSVSSASGLLKRNISAATGVSASTAPAIRPAAAPNQRRTVAYSSADRRDALERLRHEDAPRVDAEDPGRDLHDPQRRRRLVDGDEVRRVGRAEEERLPALRRRPGRRPSRTSSPSPTRRGPQVEHRGCRRAGRARRAAPSRIARRRAADERGAVGRERRRPGGRRLGTWSCGHRARVRSGRGSRKTQRAEEHEAQDGRDQVRRDEDGQLDAARSRPGRRRAAARASRR